MAVKGLKISSLGQEPQATVSVRKKDKCLVSNWIWLELGFGLSSLCRLRVGDGPFLWLFASGIGTGGPERQGLGVLPTPPLCRRKLRPRLAGVLTSQWHSKVGKSHFQFQCPFCKAPDCIRTWFQVDADSGFSLFLPGLPTVHLFSSPSI